MNDGKKQEKRGETITVSGRAFWPLENSGEIVIEDIAHHLAMIARYGGALTEFYSVAEHCWHMSHAVAPEFALEALLHDAAETYLGDIRRPLKYAPFMEPYRLAEHSLTLRIFDQFDVACSIESRHAIDDADTRICVDEVNALHAHPDAFLIRNDYDPLGVIIEAWDWRGARAMYLARFLELTV